MWTRFMDMHSGGGQKEEWARIFIEAPEEEARVIFYNRFDHSPDRVTCTCCGEDYCVDESKDLKQSTGFDRGCRYVSKKGDGHYIEDNEEIPKDYEQGWSSKYRNYVPLEEYLASDDVLVIYADDIKPEERRGTVPEEGYVWL